MSLPRQNRPSRVTDFTIWVANSTSELLGILGAKQDEWKKQFNTNKPSAAEHNKPFGKMLKERTGYDCLEIPTFMNWSLSCENETSCIEAFCEDAEHILLGLELANVEEPRAWVSDRNYWLLKDATTEIPLYRDVLGRIDFYKVLQNERFREGPSGEMVGPNRRLFVSNPDGASVLAILKTANEFQVHALHDLLANYITSDPSPSISLEVSNLWNTSYVISFTLPFYAIGLRGREDKRTLHDKELFRARFDLGSFTKEELRSILTDAEDLASQERLVLHQGVYSFSATGVTEEHWMCYCFEDEFFESEPRILGDWEEIESPEESVDPIIVEVDVKDTATQWCPRQYCLAALAVQLNKIFEHHVRIYDAFDHGLSLRSRCTKDKNYKDLWKGAPGMLSKVLFYNMEIIEQIEGFLAKDILLSQEGVPQGALWQSVRDVKALRSLRKIREALNKLKGIGYRLGEMKRSLEKRSEELRREKKLQYAEGQHLTATRVEELTFAALVYGILSLVAQVYSSKPEKDDEGSWPAYLSMVASMAVICAAVTIYVLRNNFKVFCKVLLLKGYAQRIWRHLIWHYSDPRLVLLRRSLKRLWRREEPQLPI